MTHRYWHVMTYGCSAGEFSMPVYLEEGCEGPKDVSFDIILRKDHPFRPGETKTWYRTTSGRVLVPVPMYAFRCPNGHAMSHVRWQDDRDLDPRPTRDELDPNAPRFDYPKHPEKRDACGVPVQSVGAR